MSNRQPREHKGTPAGGRYAPTSRPASGVTIGPEPAGGGGSGDAALIPAAYAKRIDNATLRRLVTEGGPAVRQAALWNAADRSYAARLAAADPEAHIRASALVMPELDEHTADGLCADPHVGRFYELLATA